MQIFLPWEGAQSSCKVGNRFIRDDSNQAQVRIEAGTSQMTCKAVNPLQVHASRRPAAFAAIVLRSDFGTPKEGQGALVYLQFRAKSYRQPADSHGA